ncbi:hypothetical protein FA13DRAFT_1714620 [Coprinellus micaceus]|uniref:Uncharacterized protein n=1 Tax=Coprinellus micaceus TaxID=71717 RepID=A0A4Y7ST66_COPMI|nr:hypothetical protein FA13DRAFT_1714620 [Coprinellus micaceus]
MPTAWFTPQDGSDQQGHSCQKTPCICGLGNKIPIKAEWSYGFRLLIIAVYAPWNPGGSTLESDSWPVLTETCCESEFPWTIIGNLNATVTQAECAAGGAEARPVPLPPMFGWMGSAIHKNPSPPPRIRVPLKAEKYKYESFRNLLMRIFIESATLTLGRNKKYNPQPCLEVTNEKIVGKLRLQFQQSRVGRRWSMASAVYTLPKLNWRCWRCAGRGLQSHANASGIWSNGFLPEVVERLIGEQHSIGAAIHAEKAPQALCSIRVTQLVEKWRNEHRQMRRKALNRELYAEKKQEVISQAKKRERSKTLNALRGSSTKKLFHTDYGPLPTVVNDLDNSNKLVSQQDDVKATTKEYFQHLYSRVSTNMTIQKPWMDTPSVKKWPRKATIQDFCAMLRHRNARPSPGPDGWEKWIIKSHSDEALNLVLNLHNYEVMHARFPVKRDQMKGFDYLSPQGFYDTITVYSLPSSIIDLDRASQMETKCFIQIAYGYTGALTVSGVTKQGGPLSPLKCTFTTSLGHRYLGDLTEGDADALVICTKSCLAGDPHVKEDHEHLKVAMVEATDDSYLLSLSLDGLWPWTRSSSQRTAVLTLLPELLVKKRLMGQSMKSLHTHGIRKLSDFGRWTLKDNRVMIQPVAMDFGTHSVWSKGVRQNLDKLSEVLSHLTLEQITGGDAELALPRDTKDKCGGTY